MTKSYISENIPNPTASPEKRFFQVALFSPLILPLIPLISSPAVLDLKITDPNIAGIGMILIFSLVLGGIPYLLFLVGLFAWMEDKNAIQVRHMTYIAPLLFVPVLAACFVVFGVIGGLVQRDAGIPISAAGMAMVCSICALLIGYAYVGIANLCFVVFRELGGFRLV